MLYALVDGDTTIRVAHLRSALGLWDYAARSVAWATRAASADPVAEQVHAALAASPDGLTRAQLRDLFGRNLPGGRIDQALTTLSVAGCPAEVWAAISPARPAATEPGSRSARAVRQGPERSGGP